MLKVGIKYCGGCNPYYDRVALLKSIEDRLKGYVQFVAPDDGNSEIILVLEGCRTACADLNSFDDRTIRLISCRDDGEDFINEILG
jgi:hypothetical protein